MRSANDHRVFVFAYDKSGSMRTSKVVLNDGEMTRIRVVEKMYHVCKKAVSDLHSVRTYISSFATKRTFDFTRAVIEREFVARGSTNIEAYLFYLFAEIVKRSRRLRNPPMFVLFVTDADDRISNSNATKLSRLYMKLKMKHNVRGMFVLVGPESDCSDKLRNIFGTFEVYHNDDDASSLLTHPAKMLRAAFTNMFEAVYQFGFRNDVRDLRKRIIIADSDGNTTAREIINGNADALILTSTKNLDNVNQQLNLIKHLSRQKVPIGAERIAFELLDEELERMCCLKNDIENTLGSIQEPRPSEIDVGNGLLNDILAINNKLMGFETQLQSLVNGLKTRIGVTEESQRMRNAMFGAIESPTILKIARGDHVDPEERKEGLIGKFVSDCVNGAKNLFKGQFKFDMKNVGSKLIQVLKNRRLTKQKRALLMTEAKKLREKKLIVEGLIEEIKCCML